MDRSQPRLFNIDYWHLRAIRGYLTEFLERNRTRLNGATALDFGSAKSPYTSMFAEAGLNLIPADIGEVGPGVLRISDDGRLPLGDATVDLVLSTQVLEHIPQVTAYLREAIRVLKPGGILLLSTHGTWHLHRYPQDMRRWTIDGLRYEIEQAGFNVQGVEPLVGRMATCTYQRMAVISDVLRPWPLLAPIRAMSNLIGNMRMGLEELCTTQAGRDALQQILIANALKP